VITNKSTFDPPTRLSEVTLNLIRSSHGHFTPFLKISCKSVQPFSRNVADKERKKERNRPKTIPRPLSGTSSCQRATAWQLCISVNKWSAESFTAPALVSMGLYRAPVAESVRDLCILVSSDLSPSMHISDIVVKAHKHSAGIYRAFLV